MQNSERFSALLKSKFCKELGQDLARELLNKSTLMMTTDDKEVVRQSEVPKGLYLIVSGAVYVSALTPEGDRAQLNILRDGDVVGQVRLEYDVEPDNGASAEISFWIGRAHWGKGIGRDVVKLFTRRSLRDNPWLTSLIARVHEDNVKSMKSLLNAGYVVEGADKKRANWVQLRLQREDTGL